MGVTGNISVHSTRTYSALERSAAEALVNLPLFPFCGKFRFCHTRQGSATFNLPPAALSVPISVSSTAAQLNSGYLVGVAIRIYRGVPATLSKIAFH